MELALFKLVLQKPKGANDGSVTMFEVSKVLWDSPVRGGGCTKLVTRYEAPKGFATYLT